MGHGTSDCVPESIRPGGDSEASDEARAHRESDELLLAYIVDPEIRQAYEALTRWFE